ncbi:MAG: PEP-CTERM sorting domain-containing protein [Aquabacterium sp.]
MNQLKMIAAAVALAAAGVASANVLHPTSTTEGGEMSLTVYSKQAGASFLFDTGIMLADFRANPFQSWSMDGNGAFDTFLSIYNAAGANDMSWTFFGGDNSGVPATAITMITTVSGDASLVTNGAMRTAMNNIKANYLDAANLNPQLNQFLSGPGVANASGVFVEGVDGQAYFLDSLGPDLRNGSFQDTGNVLGGETALWDFVRSSTRAFEMAIGEQIGVASFKQQAGSYTFAVTPVPEPSTYALVIAGLAVAGIAARRRAAK